MSVNRVVIDAANPDSGMLKQAVALISQGEILVCPTDTGYALSVNALDPGAIERVFRLKGRDYANPMHVAVSSAEEAAKYAYWNEAAEHLSQRFLPGALTLVLPRRESVPSLLVNGLDTIGVRIPDNKIILGVSAETGLPLTATSANRSGLPTPYTTAEIVEQLGEDIEKVAMVLDQGEIRPHELSTIVDLTVTPPRLIRQGRIRWEEVSGVLRAGHYI
ncbi:L-threonylcarbamoyladenylate synthase [Chloroflexota bacterium]